MKKSVFACLLAGLFVFGLFTSCKGIQDIYAKAGCSLVFTLPGGSNSRAVEKSIDEYITHYDVCVRDQSDAGNHWDALLFEKNKVKAGDTVRVKGLKPDMKVVVKVLPYAKSENGTFILMKKEWVASEPITIVEDEPAVANITITTKELIEPKYEIPEKKLGSADTPIKNVNELKDAIAAVKTKDFPTRLFLADNSTFTYDGYEIGENNKGYGIYVTGNVELYQEAKAITSVPAITFEQKGNSTFFYVENGASLKIKNNGYCKINFDSSAVCNVKDGFTANCPFFEIRGNGVLELDGVEVKQTHRISFITSAKTGKAIINNCKFNVVDYGRTEYQPVIELNDKAILEISKSTISNCKNVPAISAAYSASINANGVTFQECKTGVTETAAIIDNTFSKGIGIVKLGEASKDNKANQGKFDFSNLDFSSSTGFSIYTGSDIILGGTNSIPSIFAFYKIDDNYQGYNAFPRLFIKQGFNNSSDETIKIAFPSYYISAQKSQYLNSGYYDCPYSNYIVSEDGSQIPYTEDFAIQDIFSVFEDGNKNSLLGVTNNGKICKKFKNGSSIEYNAIKEFVFENSSDNNAPTEIKTTENLKYEGTPYYFYGSNRFGAATVKCTDSFPSFLINAQKNINNDYDVIFDGSYGPIVFNAEGTEGDQSESIFKFTGINEGSIYYSRSTRALFKDITINATECNGICLDDHHVSSNASTITGNFVRIQNCEINVDKGYYPVLITGKRCTVALSGETVPDVYVNGTEANVILESSPKNVNIKVDGTRFVLVANKTEYTQLTTVKIILPNNYAEMYSGDNKQIVECSGIANVKNVLNVEVYDNDGNAIPYNNETGELIIE